MAVGEEGEAILCFGCRARRTSVATAMRPHVDGALLGVVGHHGEVAEGRWWRTRALKGKVGVCGEEPRVQDGAAAAPALEALGFGLLSDVCRVSLVVVGLTSVDGRRTCSGEVYFCVRERSVTFKDFDDLKFSSHGKSSSFNYTNAGNIANYLKLQEVDSIHLPVPVNFIFIGFEGKGSHEFKLLPEEIERWFTKIDHIFEHTRIRHEEVLTPFYKSNIDKMRWHHLPVVSHINYK
ncbi:hypothetical protein LR48_Vigan102s001700 [Vigna angularis]|uniref:Uncharacterized protein n=1 Tax=Phaseolus angularis TaxID=3914 RepID=A0A0L9T5H3_PHAAN|nr:hypothetical protein LR48_Vigan102s001700 [Vigna angularis]